MKLAWPICHFIGGYGDLLQKVEVLEHQKNETVPDTIAILGAKMHSDGV